MKLNNNSILESIGEGILVINNEGIIKFINPAGLDILSYETDELIDKALTTIYKEFISIDKLKLFNKKNIIFSSKKHLEIPVEININPLKDEPYHYVILFKNISEKLQEDKNKQLLMDNLLKENEIKKDDELSNLKLSLMNAPAVIAIWKGPEHIYEFVNDELIKTIGKREYIGKTVREAIPEIAGQGFYEILDEVYKTGKPYVGNEVKSVMDKGDGSPPQEIYWNFIYQPIFDDNDNVVGINDFSWDVTEQVLARKKLEVLAQELEIKVQERTAELAEANKHIDAERKKLNSLFMSAPAAICFLKGKDLVFDFANPKYLDMVGHRDIMGKTIRDALPELKGQGVYEELEKVFQTGEIFFSNEISIFVDKENNGIAQEGFFNLIYQPIYGLNNIIEGVSAFGFDITEQVRARQSVEQFAKALEISNKELNNFAYIASHDLKAPIRTISNYAQLLERRYKDKLDKDANDFIRFIVASSVRMQNLIDDLLQYSKISSQPNKFNKIDLNEVIKIVTDELKADIEENQALIIYNNLPVVSANKNMFITLFQNFISNSIKYRSEKKPIIKISFKEYDHEWIFSIEDNGIGINEKYYKKIFEIFKRLHSNEKYEGTGIGLANCKKIVELNNGKIWLKSEEGNGTIFYFSLPKK